MEANLILFDPAHFQVWEGIEGTVGDKSCYGVRCICSHKEMFIEDVVESSVGNTELLLLM